MINHDIAVRYVVDPGSSGYNWEPIAIFLDWLEKWDKPCLPSGRYYQLKENKVYWGAHRFYIGLESHDHAQEFIEKWGGFKSPASLEDGRFILAEPSSIFNSEYWTECKLRRCNNELPSM